METRGKKRLRELIENWEEEKPSKKLEKSSKDEKTSNEDRSDFPKKIEKVKRNRPKSSVTTKSNRKKVKTNPTPNQYLNQETLANLPESPLYKDERYLNSIKVSFTLDPNSFRKVGDNYKITDNDRKFNSTISDGSWATCKGCAQFSEGTYYYEVEVYFSQQIFLFIFLGVTDSKDTMTQLSLPSSTRSTYCYMSDLKNIIGSEVKTRKIGVFVDMIHREFALFTEKKENF